MSKPPPREKIDAVDFPVPQNREETIAAIHKIGVNQRERVRIQAAMADEMAAIKLRYEQEAAPHNSAISALTKGVHLWCATNRTALTDNNKTKTAKLASGEILWRLRPPSVSVRGTESVMVSLKSIGLDRFIRTKEEINKEAILNEPEVAVTIKGISISQKEDFIIKPFDTQLEEVV